MECYCEPASDTGEYSTVWSVTWQKARKRHFCYETALRYIVEREHSCGDNNAKGSAALAAEEKKP